MTRLYRQSVAALLLQFLLLSATIEGFQNHLISRQGITKLFASSSDNDDDLLTSRQSSKSSPLSSQLEEGKFNPFDYQRGDKTNRSSSSNTASVSLRSMRMSSLTNDLLNCIGDAAAMRKILEDNRDFLLEPLEIEDSLAASESNIYTPGMSRQERYRAYKVSVETRLKSSRNQQAKAVLGAMKDYVLEFQNESPS